MEKFDSSLCVICYQASERMMCTSKLRRVPSCPSACDLMLVTQTVCCCSGRLYPQDDPTLQKLHNVV